MLQNPEKLRNSKLSLKVEEKLISEWASSLSATVLNKAKKELYKHAMSYRSKQMKLLRIENGCFWEVGTGLGKSNSGFCSSESPVSFGL